MSNLCNPTNGICMVLAALETHLIRRDFMNPELSDPLLPADTPIQFLDAVDLRKTPYANPIVAYKIGDIVIQRSAMGQLSNAGICDMHARLTVTVSTAVKSLTQALAFELGSVLWALDKPLKSTNAYLLRVIVGGTEHNPENHCYESVIQIEMGLGKPMWKTSTIEGIVREVELKMSASNSTLS